MNVHALGILELARVLAFVSQRAHSAPGAAAVRALRPQGDRRWIEAEHRRVGAMRALIAGDAPYAPEPIPELAAALARLRVAGASWSADELRQGGIVLRSSRRTRDALRDPRRPALARALLAPLAERLLEARAEEEAIARAIADDGTVRDEASPALRRLRHELRRAEGELVRLLEREMRRLAPHHQVVDLSVTLRNGRWVMPVRREARALVGGIVHDTSGTGATIFVEPPAAVEFGNRLRELALEEEREVERILRELTARLHPRWEELVAAFDALVALDALLARARYAHEVHAGELEFVAPHDGCEFVHARHPLLLAQGIAVVPFTLRLEPGERTLLVSGPNTGGKTVLLKAIGLLAMLAQCGVPVPVAGGSRLPVFDDVFADVGDEQSIEASLSTFSAHLKHQGEILARATDASLVLMDEVGSGTDPAEGAALGGAILETLTRRGVLTIATTHLGQLKLLATDVPGVVNASLQFDAVELAPTYRLIKGVPGRSYGLSIARRLQLPEAVLSVAEARLPSGERDLAVLLADVEAREARLAEREGEAERENQRARSRMAAVADRERKVREQERELERASRQDARRHLLEARAEVERAIAVVRAAAAAASVAPEAIEAAAREARRAVEDAAAAQQEAVRVLEGRAARHAARGGAPGRTAPAGGAPPTPRSRPLVAGDAVLVRTLGDRAGTVVEVRGEQARVLVGSVTLAVPCSALTPTAAPPPPAIRLPAPAEVPDVDPVREVDLRGMRADEIEAVLQQAIDAAVRHDLRELRVIHGKGTGALRERVGEVLRLDRRVATHRWGAWNEGGAGVTVAELR
jgi:DNA mismatch repair protein MutS2